MIFALAPGLGAQTSNRNFEVVSFGAPPAGSENWGDTVSVAADGKGSILVLRRAEPPVLVFNRDGDLVKSWGRGLFPDIHSIDVDHEGFVWITDTTDHMVYKFTMDGEQLLASDFDLRNGRFDWELLAVRAQTADRAKRTHLAITHPGAPEGFNKFAMRGTEAFWNETLDVVAFRFRGA